MKNMRCFMATLLSIALLITGGGLAEEADHSAEVVKSYLQMLIDGEYEESEALLDETMLAQLSQGGGTQAFVEVNLYPVIGELMEVASEPMFAGEAQGFQVYQAKILTTLGGHTATMYVDSQNLIAGYQIIQDVEAAIVMPEGFTETEFTVDAGGGYPLDGRIVKPSDPSQLVPCILLIQGSGALDFDEIVGANRIFGKLARGLAQRGFATLRYNKRTNQYPQIMSEKDYSIQTEYMEDVHAAVGMLLEEPGIDPERIFVLGHSEGGMLAPAFMAADPALAGMILLAGTPRNMLDISVDQSNSVMDYYNAAGMADVAAAQQEVIDTIVARKEEVDNYTAEEALEADPIYNFTAYYLYSLNQIDGVKLIQELAKPTLILQGDNDHQVYADKDFMVYQNALSDADFVQMKVYAGLSHLFLPSQATNMVDAMNEYYASAEIPAEVFDDIAAWIHSAQE